MIDAPDIEREVAEAATVKDPIPLWFDVKGRQLRVTEVVAGKDKLELFLNHPIKVETPVPVLFKAGEEQGLCVKVEGGGKHLIFAHPGRNGPIHMVKKGESIHIRHPSLEVGGPIFVGEEVAKIEEILKFNLFTRFYLSYVESWEEVYQFREFIGPDAELALKIESKKGLDFVANKWKKVKNTRLVAARGDLYVEVDSPHHIMKAVKFIVSKDPEAIVGSRLLLSMVPPKCPVCKTETADPTCPRCADFSDLAWLYDIGCRSMLLCDELCLQEKLMARSVNVFEAFRNEYS
jgi:pyruvate kinase